MSMTDHVTPAFADARVLDADGTEHRFGDLWKERTAVVVFLRHYGWLHCRELYARMAPHLESVRNEGAELVVMGLGQPHHLQWFLEDEEVQVPAFTDPKRKTYKAAGFKRGVLNTMNPASAAASVKALKDGHRQTSVKGDAIQQGGVVIVRPDGSMPYIQRSKFPGDHPEPEEVLDALRAS